MYIIPKIKLVNLADDTVFTYSYLALYIKSGKGY